ncbi:NADH:flavin oxidoreductase/NADH oxidase family protein [Alteromonas sp. CYL-A6]|uniref:NADH:flavin oxidoreductase/NADH oxidase family protein n=1 Tax=Alteromonas nitratireducens TaxID=3390813 RepID=UPI0034AB2ADB
MTSSLFTPFVLPCGQTVKNRIVKAAMEENMAEAGQQPGRALFTLYQRWADGGAGMIITGNVMVDKLAMTGPGGLALEDDSHLDAFRTLAESGKRNGARLVMQINHPGRQVFAALKGKMIAPSAVALNMGKHSHLFGTPSPMTADDINDVKQRFVTTALLARQAGFDGVQIHAAHGYLLSQFLSPLTNLREDEWGGTIENRARLLLDIVRAVREATGNDFILAVKLNTADFQRGGFDVDDAKAVVSLLEATRCLDFVELSGGSYESPAMQGRTRDDRTLAREAYFLEMAKDIADMTRLPLMTTGGISRRETAETVVNSGIALVGIASALAFTPDLPKRWQSASAPPPAHLPHVTWKDKTLAGLATMAIIKRQLRRLGAGRSSATWLSPVVSLIIDQVRAKKLAKRYRETVSQVTQ